MSWLSSGLQDIGLGSVNTAFSGLQSDYNKQPAWAKDVEIGGLGLLGGGLGLGLAGIGPLAGLLGGATGAAAPVAAAAPEAATALGYAAEGGSLGATGAADLAPSATDLGSWLGTTDFGSTLTPSTYVGQGFQDAVGQTGNAYLAQNFPQFAPDSGLPTSSIQTAAEPITQSPSFDYGQGTSLALNYGAGANPTDVTFASPTWMQDTYLGPQLSTANGFSGLDTGPALSYGNVTPGPDPSVLATYGPGAGSSDLGTISANDPSFFNYDQTGGSTGSDALNAVNQVAQGGQGGGVNANGFEGNTITPANPYNTPTTQAPWYSNMGSSALNFAKSNAALLGAGGLAIGGQILGPKISAALGLNNVPGSQNLQSVAQTAGQQNAQQFGYGTQLEQGLLTGNLPSGAQAAVNQATQNAIATIKSKFGALGLSGSTMEADAIAQAQQQAQVNAFQIEQQMAQQGAQAINSAASDLNLEGSIYTNLMNATIQQDQALGAAIGKFASAVGQGAATGAGAQAVKQATQTATAT